MLDCLKIGVPKQHKENLTSPYHSSDMAPIPNARLRIFTEVVLWVHNPHSISFKYGIETVFVDFHFGTFKNINVHLVTPLLVQIELLEWKEGADYVCEGVLKAHTRAVTDLSWHRQQTNLLASGWANFIRHRMNICSDNYVYWMVKWLVSGANRNKIYFLFPTLSIENEKEK